MKTLEAIKKRRSTRQYLDKDIEFSKIAEIIEAGSYAPNAGNLQNWKFIIVKDKANIQKIAETCLEQYWMASAPAMIVVCSEDERSEKYYGDRGKQIYNIQNCAAAAQNIVLAATDLGLATCWVSAYKEENIRHILNMPANTTPQVVITIGYSKEVPQEKYMLELKDLFYFDSWGTTIKNLERIMGIESTTLKEIFKKGKELLTKVIKK